MFTYGGLLQNQLDVWRLTIQNCPTFNRLHLLWDQTHLDYSPKLLTNKGNGTLHHPSLGKSCTKGKKKTTPLQLFNKSKFIWSTDKKKMKGLFSGLALHMTAIWGYCVFWPKRVVYDRWQERKSRAAGLSTDMQIAFSWLLYSAWYLSSGIRYASLFTARKQLINSTKGRRKESWCFCSAGWKQKPLKWPVGTVKLNVYTIASCFTTPKETASRNTNVSRLSQTHTDIGLCWNLIDKEQIWHYEHKIDLKLQ